MRPGNRSLVHHVSAYMVDDDAARELAERDGADGRPGWDCYGELGARPDGWLGGWVPGTMGNDFPAGLGRKVPGGGKVLLNVHYDTASLSTEPDQMEIDLALDDEVEREAKQLGVGNPQWVIGDSMLVPAGPEYSNPVAHPIALFRPLYWGFFLGDDVGIAWLWWGRMLGLFAVALGVCFSISGRAARLRPAWATATVGCGTIPSKSVPSRYSPSTYTLS